MKMRSTVLLATLLGALAWVPAFAAIINVPGDQPSIQSAVAAASNGDTIAIAEGTYTESGQIVVNRNITIAGAGSDVTTITTSTDTGVSGDSRGWFLVSPGRTVTIRDLAIDGQGANICEAIRSRGVLTLTGCAIRNISSPNYQGAGAVLYGNGTVSDCTFASIGRVGVLAWGSNCSSAIISNNVYVGKASGDQIDYAVEVDAGAQATITDNEISDCKGIIAGSGATSAGIRVVSTPSGSSSVTVRFNTITRCAEGVEVGSDISDTTTVVATYNSIVGNVFGVNYAGRDQSKVNFKSNWWGSSSGPGPSGSGQGDRLKGTIQWAPYLLMPYYDDSLYLEASWNGGIYTKPGQNTIVWMRVAHLQQMVVGCQAMLGYDSTYFNTGSVAAGGGDWDDLIYQSWSIPGEIDTAIGVKGSSTAGTQSDATVAVIALTAKNIEGITQLVFRPDAVPDPGLIKSTFFCDMSGNPLWPAKVNSTNIYIDGTPPVISTVSAKQGTQELIGTGVNAVQGTVNISISANDALAGISTSAPPVVTVTPNSGTAQTATFTNQSPAGTYNYSWTVGPATPNGPAVIRATVSDRSGNSVTETRVISIGWPYTGNVLYMHNPQTYVRPNSTVNVNMSVAQLQQMVVGCQSMLGYDSTYFNIGSVAAGGGDWDEMIYQSWTVPGEIDAAIGVKGSSTAGTQADGTVAVISLTTKNVEGITQLVFRPDAVPDPGLIKSTFFCDMDGNPVWPGKINSTNIYIDGTPPVISTTSAKQGTRELIGTGVNAVQGTVNISISASDVLSGIATSAPPVVTVTPSSGSAQTAAYISQSPEGIYNYSWTVGPATPNGPAVIRATVSDRSGNTASAADRTISVLLTTDNLLYMEAPGGGDIYTRPYWNVQIGMKVANLRQRVNACQAMLGYDSTYFNLGSVVAGGGDWDEMIYQSWSVSGQIDTAIGVKGSAVTGTQADGTVGVITLAARSLEGITQLVFRPDAVPDPGLIKSTFFCDMSGDPVWPAKINSTNIYIDGTSPVISAVTAKQGTQNLLAIGVNAVQGTVNIGVVVSDALSGIGAPPVVAVTPHSGTAQPATFTGEGPAGTYNYSWTVSPTTPNGTTMIRVTAYDRSGNSASATRVIRVNKNTISGQIELDGFIGAGRSVTFVANGSERKAWSINVTGFSGGVASYTLVDVPEGETSLSASTSCNLRRKLTLTGGVNGQWTAAFIGANKLFGGDLDGSNVVNLLDYSILKVNWFTGNSVADINGDQYVNTLDYSIMKSNWFAVGDPE